MTDHRWFLPVLLAAGLALSFAIPRFALVDKYQQMILMFVGINIILAASLNLVNGHMGEFSLGSAGFMAVGAYTAAKITLALDGVQLAFLPSAVSDQVYFGFALLCSMATAALAGLLVGMPSLRLPV